MTEDGVNDLVYTFTRTGDISSTLTVDFITNGTASAADDYVSSSTGQVVFAANSSTATVTINPTPDLVVELDETVTLTVVDGPGYRAGTANIATGTILNDDNASLTVDTVSLVEGDAGSQQFLFTVTLNGGVDTNLSVDFATAHATELLRQSPRRSIFNEASSNL